MTKLGREVAVLGVGMTPFSKYPGTTADQLAVDAVSFALQDAGMEWKDMQAMVCSSGVMREASLMAGHYLARIMGYTGIPVINIENACATGGACIGTLTNMIATGAIDIGIAVGMDVAPKGFYGPRPGAPEGQFYDTSWVRYVMGAPNPLIWALACRKRMANLGTTVEDMALCKVYSSRHSVSNEKSRYRKAFTVEEVLASPIVSDPLRLLMMCNTSDGGGATILGTVEEARKHTTQPVIVAAAAVGSPIWDDPTIRLSEISVQANDNGPEISETVMGVKQAYEQSGMGPEDIDFIELPDNSSWHYLVYLDTVLQAEPGTAERMVRAGDTTIGGKFPVNPSGGMTSLGEAFPAQGEAQVHEITLQFRGQAGPRQIEGAKAAMATVYGAAGNNATVILKK